MVFFNDTATTEIYTLSLHDALPICHRCWSVGQTARFRHRIDPVAPTGGARGRRRVRRRLRLAEHTSEIPLPPYSVCRLLLEKKHKYLVSLRLLSTLQSLMLTPCPQP